MDDEQTQVATLARVPGFDDEGQAPSRLIVSSVAPSRFSRLRWPIVRWAFLSSADVLGLGVVPTLTRTSGRMPLLLTALVAVLLFQSKGLYRPHLHLSVLDDLPSLLPRSVSAALAVAS